MNRCPHMPEVQDWLDGTLTPEAAARFEAHLAGCAECEAEAAAYRVVFSELRALLLLDPRPELFERIMEQVLPTRAPRWVRIVGWSYAGAFAASIAAIGSACVLPVPNAWLRGVIAAATRSLTDTSTFVLGSLGSGFARLGEALSGGSSAGRMWKLLWGALAHPEVMLTVLAAVAVCAGVLWWMRPRDERETGEIPHVGLLGL